jgi:endonuclease/exonuclease/phosphatase family metal-dependent hydrolase
VIFVNVHLSPGENKTEKRLIEIKEILNFINDYDVVILAGDFNDKIDSNIYSYLIQNNYKSAVKSFVGEELNTFPSEEPVKCLDYVWVKGEVDIKNAVIFGSANASDHKGIKVTLDI